MAEHDEDHTREESREPDSVEEPTPSAPTPILSYDTSRRANFKTLRRMPAFEANLAAAKLEAAGIPAFVGDENMASTHPVLLGQVRLQVEESSLERAAAILDAPPAEAAEGEYVDEEYRCPACHRKAVDLLPLSGRIRSIRLGCLGVLVAPVVVLLLAGLLAIDGEAVAFPPVLIGVWVVTLAVLSYLVLTAKRHKRCRECGHEW